MKTGSGYNGEYLQKKGPQKQLPLQRVRDYTTYGQALPKNSIEEKVTQGVSPDLGLRELLNTLKGYQAMKECFP